MTVYSDKLNRRLTALSPSKIRKFFDIAEQTENVISLSVGEPDYSTPWHIREVGIGSLQKGATWYTSNAGLFKLREAIAGYIERHNALTYDPAAEVLVTVGGSEAIDLALRTILNPGDEVLIPTPAFVCYEPLTVMAGGVPVTVPTAAADSFRLTPAAMESAITPRTKALLLSYPNNPTGAVMRREHLEPIARLACRYDLMVISDEIYGALTYGDTPHCSIATLPGMRERTVYISGFSKAFAMTGWRLGYAAAPAPILAQMTKLHQYAIMCAPTTAQYAAVEAMANGDADVALMREDYDMRRRLMLDAFARMGLPCFAPEGAFYVFPSIRATGLSSEEFCRRLLHEQKVAVVPGNAFGDCGEGFVRVTYCYSIDHLVEAIPRMEAFVKGLTPHG